MSPVDWYVEAREFGSCSCGYACPCQFEADPISGDCRGFEALQFDRGHFGDIDLAGLRAAIVYAWPGPIYKGHGQMQIIIDPQADEAQRRALETLLSGGETDDGATHWWVYRTMCDTLHPTRYLPVQIEMDMEARTARVEIPGMLQSSGRPIRSPVTGEPHRVRIDIPNGIEYEVAEIASATTHAEGPVTLDLIDTYGQFNRLRHSRSGVVHAAGP